MRALLDNNVNVRFGRLLTGHEITHVQDLGWEALRNGELIRAASEAGFDVLITADKQMRHQQSITDRHLSIVVLNSLFIKWDHIRLLAPLVQASLDPGLSEGSFVIIHPKEAR